MKSERPMMNPIVIVVVAAIFTVIWSTDVDSALQQLAASIDLDCGVGDVLHWCRSLARLSIPFAVAFLMGVEASVPDHGE